MDEQNTTTPKMGQLKDVLIDELIDQLKNGPVVLDDDGKAERISPSPALLAVAAKVVKDWASETEDHSKKASEAEGLLRKYANAKQVTLIPAGAA